MCADERPSHDVGGLVVQANVVERELERLLRAVDECGDHARDVDGGLATVRECVNLDHRRCRNSPWLPASCGAGVRGTKWQLIDQPGVITGAAHLALPRFARVSRLEVEVVGLVRPDLLAMIPRDGPELAHDLRLDADFLDELAREALLQRFARIETARRHLRSRFRQITMLEYEQLVARGSRTQRRGGRVSSASPAA